MRYYSGIHVTPRKSSCDNRRAAACRSHGSLENFVAETNQRFGSWTRVSGVGPPTLGLTPTIIDQEFVNFLLMKKFHGVHSSSHAQIYPDYVILSWLHNSIFFVFIGKI